MTYRQPSLLVERLEELGLSESEAKAYVTVVTLGPSTALEIAREGKLQRTHIYKLMEDLTTLGLVEVTVDKPRRYHASEISHSILTLAQELTQRSGKIAAESKQIAKRLGDLAGTASTQTRPSIDIITGFENIEREFIQSLDRTKSEVWIAMGSARLSQTRKSFMGNLNKAIAARSIGMRALVDADRANLSMLKNLPPQAKVRYLRKLDVPFYGFDSHTVCIGIGDRVPSYLRVVNYPLVDSMRSLFNRGWDLATPLEIWITGLRQPAKRKVRLVWGQEATYEVVQGWSQRAKNRVAAILDPYLIERSIAIAQIFRKPLKRNLKLQAVSFVTTENLQAFKQLNEIGEIRHINSFIPFTIGLLDDSEAIIIHLLPSTPQAKEPLYVSIHMAKSAAAKGIARMFDSLWEHSIPLETRIEQLHQRTK
jgi:sugar-specific transcriptional regulator TrmB